MQTESSTGAERLTGTKRSPGTERSTGAERSPGTESPPGTERSTGTKFSPGTRPRRLAKSALVLATVAAAACGSDSGVARIGLPAVCELDQSLLIRSLAPNAIPALTNPPMVSPDAPEASFLFDSDRVVGVVINGEARAYPYGSFDQLNNSELIFPMAVDNSRPIKERTLVIRVGSTGGRGYPFLELDDMGAVTAVNETVGGIPTAVFYMRANGQTALGFDARVGDQTLTFDADEANGVFVDRETGSTWLINGVAVDGPLAGERLQTRADAYTVFWYAWRHFQPDGTTFSAP